MEKRYYPRINKPFSAVVQNENGVNINVMAMDTSNEGLSIKCNTFARNQITPGGRFVKDDGKPVELTVWLDLPVEEGKAETVAARCHVAFSRRLSSDQCKIGMRYMELDHNGYQTLLKYLESAMRTS